MKSMSNLSLLLIIITLLVTLTAAKPTTNPVNLIPIACVNSTKLSLCVSVLSTDPTAKTANLKSLAFIALKAAANTAANTTAQIKALVDQESVEEPQLEDGLRDCAESYLDVVDQIEDSHVDALVSEKFEKIDMWIKAAVADIVTCDGGMKGQIAPSAKEILKKNQNVKDLCNNALEVVHILAKSN